MHLRVGEKRGPESVMKPDAVLHTIVQRLVIAYQPEKIYLFGSCARGDYNQDSDYDLLLIVPDDSPAERKSSRLAYQVLWGVKAATDVVVWTKTQFENRLHLKASFPSVVQREGKVLHAA